MYEERVEELSWVSGGGWGGRESITAEQSRHCLAGAPHLRAFSHAGRRAGHWPADLPASLRSIPRKRSMGGPNEHSLLMHSRNATSPISPTDACLLGGASHPSMLLICGFAIQS
jgi:hypothetical protein